MPNTPHMALTYHAGATPDSKSLASAADPKPPENLWRVAGSRTFSGRATTSLARCAGHRRLPRPDLDRDPGRTSDGLRHPHGRCDGLAPPRARVLGRRRLRARGSVERERRL